MNRYRHQGDGPIAKAIGDDLATFATDLQALADETHDDPDVCPNLSADLHLTTIFPRNLARDPDGKKPHAPKQFLEETRDRLDDVAAAFARHEHADYAGRCTDLRNRAADLASHEAIQVVVDTEE